MIRLSEVNFYAILFVSKLTKPLSQILYPSFFFKCDPGITLIYCFDFQVDRVIFCLFLGVDVKIYEHLMSVYFPVGESVAEEQSAGALGAAAGQSILYDKC